VPLSNNAKHPVTLFSVKYFWRESSVFTLFGEHPKKTKTIIENKNPFINNYWRKGICTPG
jgi:hypothetical protein